MAVTFSKASQTKFFLDVFGPAYVLANIEPLLNAGVSLQSGFSDISATYEGAQHKLNLMVGLTQLIKAKSTASIVHAKTMDQIQFFIAELNKMVTTHTWKTHTPMSGPKPSSGYAPPTQADVAADFQNQVAQAAGIPANLLSPSEVKGGFGGFAKAYPDAAQAGYGTGGGSSHIAGASGGGASGTFVAGGGGVGGAGGASVGTAKGWPPGKIANPEWIPGKGLTPKKAASIVKGLAAQVEAHAINATYPQITSDINKYGEKVTKVSGVPCVDGKEFTLPEAMEIKTAWKKGFDSIGVPTDPDTVFTNHFQLTDDDHDVKTVQHASMSGEPVIEIQKIPNPGKVQEKLKTAKWAQLLATVHVEAYQAKMSAFDDALQGVEVKSVDVVPPLEDWQEGSVDVETQVYVDTKGNLKKTVKPKTSFDDVVKLRDATALGQPVRGTSGDSVYRVIAMNAELKLAVRLHSGSKVSLRAEFVKGSTPTSAATEINCLQSMGLEPKNGGQYFSAHMDCGNVPPARVIGAILLGSGIDFDEQIKSLKELTV